MIYIISIQIILRKFMFEVIFAIDESYDRFEVYHLAPDYQIF